MATAAKREAALAAAEAPDASGARSPGAARTRGPISVHLTPFAPGVARLPIHDPSRWATFYGKTASQVLRATLAKLKLAPGAVEVAEEHGDVKLMAAVRPEVLRLIEAEGHRPERVPYAVIWAGLTADEARAELAAMVAAGWRPAALEGRR